MPLPLFLPLYPCSVCYSCSSPFAQLLSSTASRGKGVVIPLFHRSGPSRTVVRTLSVVIPTKPRSPRFTSEWPLTHLALPIPPYFPLSNTKIALGQLMADNIEIEELHRAALLRKSTTYTDPHTGFVVFTELAHLQRGQCCGNLCRHCPYGWENVRHNRPSNGNDHRTQQDGEANEEGNGKGRRGPIRSGDAVAIQARLREIHEAAKKQAKLLEQQQHIATTTLQASASLQDEDTTTTRQPKTGGRHGGRLTKKNVPYTRGGDQGTSQLLTGERRSKADLAFEAMGTVDELCSFVGVVHAQLVVDDQNRVAACTTTTSVMNDDGGGGSRSSSSSTTPEDAITTIPSTMTNSEIREQLLEIMSRLFDIGSHVAKPAKLSSDSSDSEWDDDDDGTDDSANASSPRPPHPKFVADGIGGGFDPVHVQELEDWIDQLTEDLPELNSFLLPTGSLAAAHLHTARCVCRRAERRIVPLVQAGVCDPTALQYVNRLSDYLFSASRWVNLKEPGQQVEIQYRRPHQGAKQRLRVTQTKDG